MSKQIFWSLKIRISAVEWLWKENPSVNINYDFLWLIKIVLSKGFTPFKDNLLSANNNPSRIKNLLILYEFLECLGEVTTHWFSSSVPKFLLVIKLFTKLSLTEAMPLIRPPDPLLALPVRSESGHIAHWVHTSSLHLHYSKQTAFIDMM